jgi:hypothetical protein
VQVRLPTRSMSPAEGTSRAYECTVGEDASQDMSAGEGTSQKDEGRCGYLPET